MPYINKERRAELEAGEYPISVGELNYVLTATCLDFLSDPNTARYEDYNDIVGVLESVKLEFYRRMVSDYEDAKIKENGDVFESVVSSEDEDG